MRTLELIIFQIIIRTCEILILFFSFEKINNTFLVLKSYKVIITMSIGFIMYFNFFISMVDFFTIEIIFYFF